LATQATIVATRPTPSVLRRLACFVYEGVLLFAVLMIAGYLFSSLTQQRHALSGRGALQGFLFLVLGIYFVWFWSHGGQTLAMKTWRIRLIGQDGLAVSQTRALARYVLSWLWFAPALLTAWFSETHSLPVIFGSLAVGVFAYAALAFLHADRQFVHDAICGTRLTSTAPPSPA
jgi:uncharacterized RDD family membrane protein YckC